MRARSTTTDDAVRSVTRARPTGRHARYGGDDEESATTTFESVRRVEKEIARLRSINEEMEACLRADDARARGASARTNGENNNGENAGAKLMSMTNRVPVLNNLILAIKKKVTAAAIAAPAPAAASAAPAKPTVMAPQVQVIDGNIVSNSQLLTINAAAEKDTGLAEFKRVEENGTRLNSATYSNRAKAATWNKEDTELFYRAMTQFDTYFSLIARLFPGSGQDETTRPGSRIYSALQKSV